MNIQTGTKNSIKLCVQPFMLRACWSREGKGRVTPDFEARLLGLPTEPTGPSKILYSFTINYRTKIVLVSIAIAN